MEPTLLPGDYFIASGSAAAPVRKEIVVYRTRGQVLIKRILGLPGDTLAMRAGVLLVNGDSLPEPYALHEGEQSGSDPSFAWQRRFLLSSGDSLRYHPTVAFWGPIVVPTAKYFVLGDNRGESADSRYYGFVDRSEIFARPRFIYFSKDRHSGRIRWNRIGRAIKDSA